MGPFFSIITPAYNPGHLIKGLIFSLQSQCFKNWELIIVDDFSDEPIDIHKLTDDFRIRVHRNEENLERSVSRNIGIDMSKGEYLIFIDADDMLLPGALTRLNHTIKKHDRSAVFFSPLLYTDRNLPVYWYLVKDDYSFPFMTHNRILFSNCRFDKSINSGEDKKYISQLLLNGAQEVHLNKPVGIYHFNDTEYLMKLRYRQKNKLKNNLFSNPRTIMKALSSFILPKRLYLILMKLKWEKVL